MHDLARKISVSGLVELLRDVVESNFLAVTVEGEISNFAAPASGHWYFTLKDAGAQLRAVMFRGRNRLLETAPRDGARVICSGTVSVYPARGELQFVVERMVTAGEGDLQAAFEELKGRLAAEGLFAAERKQPLPAFPRAVGVVTSASGAAIHDIVNILRRRAPGLRVLLRPVRVQGEGAAGEIAAAIAALNRCEGLDVLIVGRGGGSLEDLWAFNEEAVARAISASRLPVISAVGHEVDFTIADFVADLRAPTPSAAAELVAKSRQELESHLDHLVMRLHGCISRELALVDERLNGLRQRLRLAMEGLARRCGDRLGATAGRLDALSPLRQLERGYLIASSDREGRAPVSLRALQPNDILWLRFADGRARTRVEEIEQ